MAEHFFVLIGLIHFVCYTQVSSLLHRADSISCTTDAAKMISGDDAVTITASWIDEKWQLQNAVLAIDLDNGMCARTYFTLITNIDFYRNFNRCIFGHVVVFVCTMTSFSFC